ncbi:MAG: cytochrome c oxidase assembly factor Coa1 family protein [Pirellulaceae bacterium]|nr:cytochrome c oxidase assembly factor Coa1 family protein [Pirellulaceae bacterium]
MRYLQSKSTGWTERSNSPRTGVKSNTLIIVVLLLVVIGLPLCTCGGCVATLWFGVSAALQGSEPYKRAVAEAQNNAEVRELLGEPVEPGYLVSGSINLNNDGGDCDIQIPISGPKDSGSVRIRGTRSGGTWRYDEITAEINGQQIDLQK